VARHPGDFLQVAEMLRMRLDEGAPQGLARASLLDGTLELPDRVAELDVVFAFG
jgi:hypothetical protein